MKNQREEQKSPRRSKRLKVAGETADTKVQAKKEDEHLKQYQAEEKWKELESLDGFKDKWLELSHHNGSPECMEDRIVNLRLCFKAQHPDKTAPRLAPFSCDACMRMLPPGGPSEEAKGKGWHRCRTCINYDECAACYEIKKEAGSPHPHDMWKYEYGWNWAKDEGQEGELQERILSFDGGGVRGYMTCLMFEQFAKRIAQERGMGEGQDLDKFVFSELLPCFKVIGGTSIGGLIAIGLSLGVPLSKLIKTFKKDSKVIFKHEESSWLSGWIPEKLNPPVYNDEGLKHIFRSLVKIARPNLEEDEIENIRFEQLTCGWDTFVTAFDLYTNSPMVFSKRDHGSMKLLDAVLSTSAAPVYFPVHYFSRARELPKDKCKICVDGTQCKSEKTCQGCHFLHDQREYACVDGGLWANDPQFVALLYQKVHNNLANFTKTVSAIFSFGTGEAGIDVDEKKKFLNKEKTVGIIDLVNPMGQMSLVTSMFAGSAVFAAKSVEYLQATNRVWSCKLQIPLEKAIALDDAGKEAMEEQKRIVEKFLTTEKGQKKMNWAVRRFLATPVSVVYYKEK